MSLGLTENTAGSADFGWNCVHLYAGAVVHVRGSKNKLKIIIINCIKIFIIFRYNKMKANVINKKFY